MSAPPDRNRLQAALAEADLRVLLMVMFQISGEERWLQEPYRARRDVKLIADEDAGFTPDVQAEIRAAALQMRVILAIWQTRNQKYPLWLPSAAVSI